MEDERIDHNKRNVKSIANHRMNVENIVDVKNIGNADPEQLANIRDEVFIIEIEEDSDEKVLSDDTSYTNDYERLRYGSLREICIVRNPCIERPY